MKKKILAVIIVALLLFSLLASKGCHPSRLLEASWNWGHILLFVLLTYFLLRYWPWLGRKNAGRQIITIIVVTFVLGFGIELAQSLIGSGTPDLDDIVRDFLGSVVAFLFIAQLKKAKILTVVLRLAVLVLLMNELLPVVYAGWDEYQAEKQFPVLGDFESSLELSRWSGESKRNLSEDHVVHGHKSLKVELTTARYSGISLNYFPENWSAFDSLHFNVYNPDPQPLKMTCRIHDAQHRSNGFRYKDRFHKEIKLIQGWNHIHIDLNEVCLAPESRGMNMRKIYNFALFATQLPESRVIYVDYMYMK